MRRREFLGAALGASAAPAMAKNGAPEQVFSLAALPHDSRKSGQSFALDADPETRVETVDRDVIAASYREVLANFKALHPGLDLADPEAFLIVAKPRRPPGSIDVACVCQCGTSTPTSNCGGGGGGKSSRARAARAKS